MAVVGTHYSSRYEEPTPEEALEELEWETPGNPPVEEAATLILEVPSDPDAAGQPRPARATERCLARPPAGSDGHHAHQIRGTGRFLARRGAEWPRRRSHTYHQAVYEKYGMQMVFDTSQVSDNLMRKHLDLREIPAMLGHLFDDPENPLTYIAATERHVVAVVDGTVHDVFDSRDIGDRTQYVQDGRLTELWLRGADEATLAAAQKIIEKYVEARRYDDVLTYGRMRRISRPATPRGGEA